MNIILIIPDCVRQKDSEWSFGVIAYWRAEFMHVHNVFTPLLKELTIISSNKRNC